MSKKKKKTKMMNLTDVDYGNYIMALKDEKPTMIVTSKNKK
jgi:hypothetical protein